MRPWAEYLAQAGYTVSVPAFPDTGPRWPNVIRTTYSDWYAEVCRAFDALRDTCERVFVFQRVLDGRHPDPAPGRESRATRSPASSC